MGKGEVDEGALSDHSERWVSIKSGDIAFNFSFDMKGERIDQVAVFRDVWQVVDVEKLHGI